MLRSIKLGLSAIFAVCATLAHAQDANWQQEWDKTLAAAKKEGKVVVLAQPSPAMRNVILKRFTERYGIEVEHIAARSSEVIGRLRSERTAGVYSIDVFMSNAGTSYGVLYDEKFLDPLPLIRPDVADPKNWKGGVLPFTDPEKKYVLLMFKSVDSFMVINTKYVKPEEMQSAKDLLNPKWKGKIATEDPTAGGGGGAGSAAHFFTEMGPEFIKQMYVGQGTVIQRDRRQLSDWLARGSHPICLTCHIDDMRELVKEGFPLVEVFKLSDIDNRLTPAPSLLSMANNAPNPNAAKVFVNWMASKEALELYSREAQAATLRSDVDESFLDPRVIPKPGVKYVDYTAYEWVTNGRRDSAKQVRQLLKDMK